MKHPALPLARITVALAIAALTPPCLSESSPAAGTDLDTFPPKQFELLQKHIAKATIWQLFPQDIRWSTYKWVRLEDPAAAKIRTAISSSKLDNKAGDKFLIDLEFKDVVERGACLVVFQLEEGLVGFKRHASPVKKDTLALIDVTAFDPAQEKITYTSPRDIFAGIVLPQPVSEILPPPAKAKTEAKAEKK